MKFLKRIFFFIFVIILLAIAFLFFYLQSIKPKITSSSKSTLLFQAERMSDQPIIHVDLHPRLKHEAEKEGYININGPSLIRVPDWVENPLGKYYLYFAHHKGSFIKMAYANSLGGDWKMYDGEILPLEKSGLVTKAGKNTDLNTLQKYNSWSESIALIEIGKAAQKSFEKRKKESGKSSAPTTPHLASPEVIINEKTKKIHLYFHGVVDGSLQKSKVALSKDGINFDAQPEIISLPYLRVFPFRNEFYGIAMPGFLYRSKDGISNFEVRKRWLFDTNVRHTGLHLNGNDLYIFYTQVGDQPERILYTKMDMTSTDWNDWKVEHAKALLQPELEWEGGNLPKEISMRGEIGTPVNQLRDPDVFEDENGNLYLLYTGAGEQGIGMARLKYE